MNKINLSNYKNENINKYLFNLHIIYICIYIYMYIRINWFVNESIIIIIIITIILENILLFWKMNYEIWS